MRASDSSILGEERKVGFNLIEIWLGYGPVLSGSRDFVFRRVR